MPEQDSIGQFLKSTLRARRISYVHIAKTVGVRSEHIYEICSGREPVSVRLMVAMAEALGLDPVMLAEMQARQRVREYLAQRPDTHRRQASAEPRP
jgi:plasmid maintenance system antidote protein VapI